MTDVNLSQSRAASLAARMLAGNPELIQEQMRINGETVAEMQRYNARITETAIRLRRHVDFLKRCVGGAVARNDGALAVLRVELLAWLLHEADDLVLEIDDRPVLLADDTDAGIRKVSAFLVSLLCSGGVPSADMLAMVLRRRCRRYDESGCGHVDCSCGQEPRDLDVPARIVGLMREVGR